MGLDFSEGGAHWSYTGFHQFRCDLAEAIGFNYNVLLKTQEWPPGEPLVALLRHSDCEGKLTWEECASIAPRLREVIEPWGDGEDCYNPNFHNGVLLAEAMEVCAREKGDLEFR